MTETWSFRAMKPNQFPNPIEPGVLYHLTGTDQALHLCPCGCLEEVYTRLNCSWCEGSTLVADPSGPSLSPVDHDWFSACAFRYEIKEGKTVWL